MYNNNNKAIIEANKFDIWLKYRVKNIYYSDKDKMNKAINSFFVPNEVKFNDEFFKNGVSKHGMGEGCNKFKANNILLTSLKNLKNFNINIITKIKKHLIKNN